MNPPDSLKARLLQTARNKPVPSRSSARTRLAGLVALALAMTAATFFVMGGPERLGARPPGLTAAMVGGVLGVAALATWLAMPRGNSMLPPSRRLLTTLVVATPVAVGLWTMLWHLSYEDPFQRFGLRCFALTLATAPWPFIAMAYLRHRMDPVSPTLTGAALGATSGAWAAVMVTLWCPIADPGHVARGHALPIVVLALAGAALGARLFRARLT